MLYLRFLYVFQTTLVILRQSYYTETYSDYLTSQRIHYADHKNFPAGGNAAAKDDLLWVFIRNCESN